MMEDKLGSDEFRQGIEGAKVLYCEGWKVALVRISRLSTNDWGFSAQIELLPRNGLCNDIPDTWTISAAWLVFFFDQHCLRANGVGWTIYYDQHLVDAVLNSCDGLNSEYTDERAVELYRIIGEYLNP